MSRNSFAEALRIQGRVLLALMLREARTRYGRTRAGYLWALLEPAVHVTFFSVLFSLRLMVVPLGHSIVVFLVTGFATYFGFRNVMSRTGGGYGSNEALLSFPIVRVMDVFLARGLLELATWLLVTFLMLGILILLGMAPLPYNVLYMLEAILALFAIGFGAGMVIGILSEFWASLRSLMTVPIRLLYFTSATFFLPDYMPLGLRTFLVWNPVMHGITLFREGYYAGYSSPLLDERYLFMWAVGAILFALIIEKLTRRPLRSLAV